MMKENKTKPTEKSTIDFITSIPNEFLRKDGLKVLKMMGKLTNMEPKMWGPAIIGFGHHIIKYASGRETELPLISFSLRKQKLVLYVLNNFKNQESLLQKLGKHNKGKVCLYIKKLADINMEILEELIISSFNKAKENKNLH